jgi:ATP-dependent RNA helicase SUPV3L1/SUV3
MRDSEDLLAGVNFDGEVTVEGHIVGILTGLNFTPDLVEGENSKPVLTAARRVLPAELTRRVQQIQIDLDDQFSLEETGQISCRDFKIAILTQGKNSLSPVINLKVSELVTTAQREILERRLVRWFSNYLIKFIPALISLRATTVKGPARGILFQITECFGAVPRKTLNNLIRNLDDKGKRDLSVSGVRFGVHTVFMPDLLKPKAIRLLAILWRVFNDEEIVEEIPNPGRVSMARNIKIKDSFYYALGYVGLGSQVVRLDIVERLAVMLRKAAKSEPFLLSPEMLSVVGLGYKEITSVIESLGYKCVDNLDGKILFRRKIIKRKIKKLNNLPNSSKVVRGFAGEDIKNYNKPVKKIESPFAVLEKLKVFKSL